MTIKKHIPNIITLLNLFCGVLAVIFAVQDYLLIASFLIVLGIFFDFFDGFFARLLKVSGELGKQLDSLADVVTSGVAPGVIMMLLIKNSLPAHDDSFLTGIITPSSLVALVGLLIPLASAYRLAKFNIDTRQSSSFIGLPTPAFTLVVVALPLILSYSSFDWALTLIKTPWVLIFITLFGCYAMHAEIPLFALKFKDYSWKNNKIKFVFLGLSVLLLLTVQFVAIPLIIILYVLFSMLENKTKQ